MNPISKSPNRNTFQITNYINRCKVNNTQPSDDYLDFWKSVQQQDDENMINPEWQKNNLEYDLRSTNWILEKVRASLSYAQNLYAAMCNQEFQKLDVIPILKDQRWSCSWRFAGGIISDMRQEGDYIDWYCSGIRNSSIDDEHFAQMNKEDQHQYLESTKYVGEGVITDEIEADLKRLGWIVLNE